MINTTKAKADAEEGLRIAEKATEGPWHKADCVSPKIVIYAVPQGPHGFGDIGTLYLGETYCDQKGQGRANLAFIADSRTRAPEAYRNVIEMAGRLDVATSVIDRLNADRVRMLADLVDLDAKVAAAELAEEKMTRKAEEHYDRAAKMEAQRATLLDALLSVRDAAASDRGYALIDRIYAIANKVLK